jgi:hypothetical protein
LQANFWPYAYSDIFDYAFWPRGYDDGYFAYAYDDFFDGVFFGEEGPPAAYAAYAYDESGVVTGAASARAAAPSYAAVQTLCKQPGSGVTAWPIAEITDKVGLNDEQKQRFNEIGPKPQKNVQASQTSTQGAATQGVATQESNSCKDQKPGLTNLPIESIEDAVKPTDAQEADLNKLDEATGKAVSILQAACPDETPITPPGRLEAMETRLKAMIEAANTVKPALDSFYVSLNSEQKARFNRIGKEMAQTVGQSNN